jgi:hypothetical protein
MARKLKATATEEIVTGIFYRDEMRNPICSKCVEDQYPHNHGLEMEIVDEDDPTQCDGCGEEIR